MDHLHKVLELSVILTKPPHDLSSEVLAYVTLQCDALGLDHTGDMFTNPLSQRERDDLSWYLEEYWKWPYQEFAERGKQVETLLGDVGRRLYHALFETREAQKIVQKWQQQQNVQHQMSIISEIPGILRLPWELLSDPQGSLMPHTNYPISIVRRLPKYEQATPTTPFHLPLRVLLVTARPEDTGFIDPRNISREIVDELQMQSEVGNIELEFLRPPTFSALQARLKNTEHPIHVLHFDGHGGLDSEVQKQGILFFETGAGKRSPVKASDLAKVLRNSGVRLAILTACQSAISIEDDAFSSVATQLINNSVDAVIAMSSSILVTSAVRYVEVFYHMLAEGLPMSIAQEQARQALQRDPRRHLLQHRQNEEATPVELYDWWVPHFYQRQSTFFQLIPLNAVSIQISKNSVIRFPNEKIPAEPRYGFNGRAYELLQIERHLLRKKVVVIYGFGGVGKTALACEVAHWLTDTHMYDMTCLISFEHGGDAAWLLHELGHYLEIDDGNYTPNNKMVALARLKPVLGKQRTLVIVDNLESILSDGEVPLEYSDLKAFWEVLIALRELGAGILLTTRNTSFGDNRLARELHIAYLHLQGLQPDDAYILASRLLVTLGIDRTRAPYAELCDLLLQLDHHPLAIQQVLPTLDTYTLSTIRTEFAKLLPIFADNTASGHNRSLVASLEYSLQQLGTKHRTLLPLLAVFEGGANENNLLDITGIQDAVWTTLRAALERAALLTAEYIDEQNTVPFLHFHPVLIPYLRMLPQTIAMPTLHQHYAQYYHAVVNYLFNEDFQSPDSVRWLVLRELPNLRHALEILLQEGKLEDASDMANSIARFLTYFGMTRECDEILKRIATSVVTPSYKEEESFTNITHPYEIALAKDEERSGNVSDTFTQLTTLLTIIQAQPKGTETGPGSYYHCLNLKNLAACLEDAGQYTLAETHLREALVILDSLTLLQLQNQVWKNLYGRVLMLLGTALAEQGQYIEAQQKYEQALNEFTSMQDVLNETTALAELGYLALEQKDYKQATSLFQKALGRYRTLGEPLQQAGIWHELGIMAQRQEDWAEAEHCYRESLMLSERIGNDLLAAKTYAQLGKVATFMGQLAEAEGWYQRALHYFEQTTPVSSHITNCLIGLVTIYYTQQKYIKAEPLLKHALSISEQQLGATHPSTQTIQTHYALLLQEMERTKKQGGRKKILGFFSR